MDFYWFGQSWTDRHTATFRSPPPSPARSLFHNVPLPELARYANEGDRRSAEAVAVDVGLRAIGRVAS
jgi:hypothetical protein